MLQSALVITACNDGAGEDHDGQWCPVQECGERNYVDSIEESVAVCIRSVKSKYRKSTSAAQQIQEKCFSCSARCGEYS